MGKILPSLIALFTFAIYLQGVSPSVYGGDSGDIILAAYFGGVAHPPGYPLNSMIGWVFAHLPYAASVAFKVDVMSAFLMAATVGLVFLIAKTLTRNVFVAISTALILAFNPLFWLYAHIAEVFQLNLFLVAVSIYFLFTSRLFLSILFLGLAVFHHQTSVLLLPAYIYFVLATNKKILKDKLTIFKLFVVFAAGVVPYIFIPIASAGGSPVNWDRIDSIQSFIRLITRADYGTFVAIGSLLGENVVTRLIPILNYALFVRADFALGVVMIATGAVYAFFKQRTYFVFIFISFVSTGPFFMFYSGFPIVDNFYYGLWERFILITYLFLAFYLAFGLLFYYKFFLGFFTKATRNKNLHSFYRVCFTIFLFLLPLYLFRENYGKTDLGNFTLGDDLGHDVLTSAAPGALIFLLGDTVGFNTEYVYYTTNAYRDRVIVRPGSMNRLGYRRQIVKNFPQLNYPEDFLSDKEGYRPVAELVKSNMNDRPIYVAESVQNLEKNYRLTISGLLWKFVEKSEYDSYAKDGLSRGVAESFGKLRFFGNVDRVWYANYLVDHIKDIYYRSLVAASNEVESNGLHDDAMVYLGKAIELLPENPEAYEKRGAILYGLNRCTDSMDDFLTAVNLNKNNIQALETLSKIFGDCIGDIEKSREYAQRAGELKKEKGLTF